MTTPRRSWPRRFGLWAFATVPTGLSMVLVLLLGILAAGAFMAVPWASPARAPRPTQHKVIQAVPIDKTPVAAVLSNLTASLKTVTPGYTYSPALSYAIPADPALSGCSARQINWAPAPSISTSATLTSASATVMFRVDGYAAGLGQRVLDRSAQLIGSCGNGYVTESPAPPLNGFTASAAGSNEAIFRQGDVVVTLISFGGSFNDVISLATTVSNTLTSEVQPVCADINAPASAARGNPSQGDYVAPTKSVTLSPEPGQATPPDMTLLTKAPPTVPTPSTGSITSAPTPPVAPTVAMTTTVQIPTADPVGPGCGWTFSGEAVPPAPSQASISSIEQGALSQLAATWSQWPDVVTTYLQKVGTYNADQASYQQYVKTVLNAAPKAPTNLVAAPGDGQVLISWTSPPETTSPINGYTVTATDSAGNVAGTCAVSGSDGSCTVTGLANGVLYTFTVIASNANGTSPASNSVSATPQAATPPPTTTTTTTVPPTTTTVPKG